MERKEFIKVLGLGALGMGISPSAFAHMAHKKIDEEICRMAWENLCGNMSKRDVFKYVHPVKRVPNVLLYGDSISIAYTPAVREYLQAKATVFRLFRNGGSSQAFIPAMDQLQESMFQPNLKGGWDFKWDLIHFNVGLHDLKYLDGKKLSKENGTQVSSITEYKKNLEKICRYLREKFPKAKLVFATTTPVPADAQGRYEGDSIKYNKAALEVLASYPDIAINDLYSFTMPHLEQWAVKPGNVHFNKMGFTLQGEEVASVIAENL